MTRYCTPPIGHQSASGQRFQPWTARSRSPVAPPLGSGEPLHVCAFFQHVSFTFVPVDHFNLSTPAVLPPSCRAILEADEVRNSTVAFGCSDFCTGGLGGAAGWPLAPVCSPLPGVADATPKWAQVAIPAVVVFFGFAWAMVDQFFWARPQGSLDECSDCRPCVVLPSDQPSAGQHAELWCCISGSDQHLNWLHAEVLHIRPTGTHGVRFPDGSEESVSPKHARWISEDGNTPAANGIEGKIAQMELAQLQQQVERRRLRKEAQVAAARAQKSAPTGRYSSAPTGRKSEKEKAEGDSCLSEQKRVTTCSEEAFGREALPQERILAESACAQLPLELAWDGQGGRPETSGGEAGVLAPEGSGVERPRTADTGIAHIQADALPAKTRWETGHPQAAPTSPPALGVRHLLRASPVTRVLATSCSVPARATCSLHSCNSQCPSPLRLTSTRSRRTHLVSFHQAAVPALTTVSLQLDTELRTARTWLVKNSWGTSWVLNGYLKISSASNVCGVLNQPVYPQVSASV